MPTKITTLAELQAAKKKLQMQQEVAKREFFHSFGLTKTQAKDFLLTRVALPASALGLASFGIKKIAGGSQNDHQTVIKKSDTSFFLKLMPLVLPLIRAYFAKEERVKMFPPFIQELLAPGMNTESESPVANHVSPT